MLNGTSSQQALVCSKRIQPGPLRPRVGGGSNFRFYVLERRSQPPCEENRSKCISLGWVSLLRSLANRPQPAVFRRKRTPFFALPPDFRHLLSSPHRYQNLEHQLLAAVGAAARHARQAAIGVASGLSGLESSSRVVSDTRRLGPQGWTCSGPRRGGTERSSAWQPLRSTAELRRMTRKENRSNCKQA